MTTIAHHPTVQAIIDRWRLELPVPAQIDESLLTKEHLRLLIGELFRQLERRIRQDEPKRYDR